MGQIKRGTYVIRADQVNDFLAGRVSDPSDPRGSGVRGAYPTIGTRAPARLARLLYERVGVFRTIVDAPADDIWAQGWEPVVDDEPIKKRVLEMDARVQLKTEARLATRMARRDGAAFLYLRLRDATGDATQEPRGVREVLRIDPIPRDAIARVILDEDPLSETFDQPIAYEVRLQPLRSDDDRFRTAPLATTSSAVGTVRVHADRIIPVIQHRKEGTRYDGTSVLSWMFGDAHGMENVKWAAGETYFRNASPLLVAVVDKDVTISDERFEALKTDIGDVQSGLSEKLVLEGATITPIGGGPGVTNPEPYSQMFLSHAAAGARMPMREIVGDPAGALAAASWDSKRYFGRIENDRQDFASPIVRAWYDRLDRWGLVPGLAKRVRGVHWYPHLELTEEEQVRVLLQASVAMRNFGGIKIGGQPVPLPSEFQKLVTFPASVDMSLPVEASQALALPGALGQPAANARRDAAAADLRIEVSPKLRKIEDEIQTALLDAFRAWRAKVEEAIDAKRNARLLRREAGLEDLARIVLLFESEDLATALEQALMSAGSLGLLKTWEQLGQSGEAREFVKTSRAPVLAEFAKTFAAAKAQAASNMVRDVVADTIASGGGIAEIRKNLRDQFGVLENESTIARTEAMRGYNQGSVAAMIEGGVPRWRFQAYDGADDLCASLDGSEFSVADLSRLPPEGTHPNCRCSAIPVVEA